MKILYIANNRHYESTKTCTSIETKFKRGKTGNMSVTFHFLKITSSETYVDVTDICFIVLYYTFLN